MALRRVAGMFCAAVAARAGREAEGDINLRLQLKKIARAHGAGLHEILMRVTGKPRQHEDIEHIMHMPLRLFRRQIKVLGHSARQIGMAAIVII